VEKTVELEGRNGYVLYILCVACVMYATPRYIARMRMQNGSVIHGAGGEFVHRISKSANTVLNACTEILDHAEKFEYLIYLNKFDRNKKKRLTRERSSKR
jgi:hypothetical protein